MLTRGVGGAAIDNVLKVTKGLGITVEELENLVNEEDGISKDGPEAAEIAEFESFINNPEHGLFFKDYLEAPEERKRSCLYSGASSNKRKTRRNPKTNKLGRASH